MLALLSASPAAAQTGILQSAAANPFLGGVPAEDVVPEEIALTFADAIQRALSRNLGLVLEAERIREAEGKRQEERSNLLPSFAGRLGETRQQISLAAFGFTGFPGVPAVVGPFDVFDVRLFLTQPIFDLHALYQTRAATATQIFRLLSVVFLVMVPIVLLLRRPRGQSAADASAAAH